MCTRSSWLHIFYARCDPKQCTMCSYNSFSFLFVLFPLINDNILCVNFTIPVSFQFTRCSAATNTEFETKEYKKRHRKVLKKMRIIISVSWRKSRQCNISAFFLLPSVFVLVRLAIRFVFPRAQP